MSELNVSVLTHKGLDEFSRCFSAGDSEPLSSFGVSPKLCLFEMY